MCLVVSATHKVESQALVVAGDWGRHVNKLGDRCHSAQGKHGSVDLVREGCRGMPSAMCGRPDGSLGLLPRVKGDSGWDGSPK